MRRGGGPQPWSGVHGILRPADMAPEGKTGTGRPGLRRSAPRQAYVRRARAGMQARCAGRACAWRPPCLRAVCGRRDCGRSGGRAVGRSGGRAVGRSGGRAGIVEVGGARKAGRIKAYKPTPHTQAMPAAAGGKEPADLCPKASRIEEGLFGVDGEREARIECAAAYMACGRLHGEGGRLDAANKCFEKAVGLHGMWAECSDSCGEIAARLDSGGRLADAAVWYGRAAGYMDRDQDAGGSPDPRKEKKRRKRRSRWASECIRCWDALASGASPAPEEGLYAAYEAADVAAGGDIGARARMRVRMGDLELELGRFDGAAEWYGRAMELEPGNKQAALGACKALERGGQWDAALSRYEKTAGAIPLLGRECAAGCARCARALESAGNPAKALSAIESAAVLDPLHALECADMHRKRAGALAGGRQGQRQDAEAAEGKEGRADEAAAHYEKAVEWYRRVEEAGEAGAECARCARALGRMGLIGKALSAIESAAVLDPLHALECAEMHRRRADVLAGGRRRRMPEADAAAAAAAAADAAGSGRPGDAAAHYEKAVEWYRRAGKAGGGQVRAGKAAKGCARCARALGRTGLAGKALSAIEAAAAMDPLHALECAEMHRRRAGALVRGRRGTGPDRRGAGGGAEAECAAKGGPNDYSSAHYEKAVEWYRRAGKAGGGQVRGAKAAKGCIQCARALSRRGLAGMAQSAFEAAAKLDGAAHALECGSYCKRLGDTLAKDGNGLSREAKRLYGKALAYYRTAADAGNPDAPRALRDSAAICMSLGQYDRAAGLFGEAYKLGGGGGALQAECIDGCCECVLMLAAAGDGKAAARCLELDVLAGPQARSRCAEQCSARGRSEYKEERYEQAASCFEVAASIDGGDAGALLGAAGSLARLGRRDEALGQYRAVEKLGGGAGPEVQAEAQLGMAGIHEASGRRGEAAACLARAAQADPRRRSECARRCLEMGRAGYGEGWYEQAASCFEAAASIDGGGADALLGAADSLARLERHGEALGRYRAVEKLGGGAGPEVQARALLGAADSLARLGRRDEALGRYRAVEKLGGGAGPEALAEAQLGMAGLHEASGRRGEAAACLARAAQADPPAEIRVRNALPRDGQGRVRGGAVRAGRIVL